MKRKLLTFAASYYAKRITEKSILETAHSVDVIQAFGKDHAIGIGYRIVQQLYPESEGWTGYDVRVMQVLEDK